MSKLAVDECILDLKKGEYTVDQKINVILQKNDIQGYPIDVIQIAKNLGFDLFQASFKNPKIAGAMSDSDTLNPLFDSQRYIVVNKSDYTTRKLFTIAHEIAHFVLHCDNTYNFYERYLDGTDIGQDEETEKQANFFAASLLMPTEMLRRYIENNPNKSNKQKLIDDIKRDFIVSENSVLKRLEEIDIKFDV